MSEPTVRYTDTDIWILRHKDRQRSGGIILAPGDPRIAPHAIPQPHKDPDGWKIHLEFHRANGISSPACPWC